MSLLCQDCIPAFQPPEAVTLPLFPCHRMFTWSNWKLKAESELLPACGSSGIQEKADSYSAGSPDGPGVSANLLMVRIPGSFRGNVSMVKKLAPQ